MRGSGPVRRAASDRQVGPGGSGGFTLLELLIVVTIVAVLLAMLAPSARWAVHYARMTRCRVHLHGLMIGINGYASDTFHHCLPGLKTMVDVDYYLATGGRDSGRWGWKATIPTSTGLLARQELVTSPEMWLCTTVLLTGPSQWDPANDPNPWTYHFTINAATTHKKFGGVDAPGGHRSVYTLQPSRTVVLAEENSGMIPRELCPRVINDPKFYRPDLSEPRHLGMSQVGYLDGHVDQIAPLLGIWGMEEYCPGP